MFKDDKGDFSLLLSGACAPAAAIETSFVEFVCKV